MRDLGPQFEQLAMFHQAKDFVGDMTRNSAKFYPQDVESYSSEGRRSPYGQMWHEKIGEAKIESKPGAGDSLVHKIAKHGVVNPIDVFHHDDSNRSPFEGSGRGLDQPAVWDGHHRAIVAHELHGPGAELPVNHMDEHNDDYSAPKLSPKMLQGYKKPKKSR